MGDFNSSEAIEELVSKNGDKVGFHTEDCVLWKLEHKNCEGCFYELGCGKTVRLMLLMMLPLTYSSRDFDDFLKMSKYLQETSSKILKAKKVKELMSIPFP